MLIMLFIGMVFVHLFSITFAGDVDRVCFANIFQVTHPAAGRGNLQHEAIVVGVIGTRACQDEVFYERTLVQNEVCFCAGVVGSKA